MNHSSTSAGTSRIVTCSSCGREFDFNKTEFPPFCSERCQMIDLGRWFDEEIGIPQESGSLMDEDEDSRPDFV